MSFNRRKHYKAISAPPYDKYGMEPTPLREASDPFVYYVDALRLREWAVAILMATDNTVTGRKVPPCREIVISDYSPRALGVSDAAVDFDPAVGTESFFGYIGSAIKSGMRSAYLPDICYWVLKACAEGVKDKQIEVDGTLKVYDGSLTPTQADTCMAQIVLDIKEGQQYDPEKRVNPLNYPDKFLSKYRSARLSDTDVVDPELLEQLKDIRQGCLVKRPHFDAMYGICRLFSYMVVHVPVRLRTCNLFEVSRTYSRKYSVTGAWTWRRQGLYQLYDNGRSDGTGKGPISIESGDPSYDNPECRVIRAHNPVVSGGPESVSMQPGDPVVAENTESPEENKSQVIQNPTATSGSMIIYKRRISEHVLLHRVADASPSYQDEAPWALQLVSDFEDGEDTEGNPIYYPDEYEVCPTYAPYLTLWRSRIDSFERSIDVYALDGTPDNDDIILDLGKSDDNALRCLVGTGLYPDNAGEIFRAVVGVTVEFGLGSAFDGAVSETAGVKSFCTGSESTESNDAPWSVADKGDLPDPDKHSGTYIVPVSVVVMAEDRNKLKLSREDLFTNLSKIVFKSDGNKFSVDDPIYKYAEKSGLPDLPGSLGSSEDLALIPGKDFNGGLTSGHYKEGVATRRYDGETGETCTQNNPRTYTLSASRYYEVTVSLTGSLVFLYKWTPPVAVDPGESK